MTVTPRFLQFHTLHSYPAALLNRDDTGMAKRLWFGETLRTRISSQCLKRHWRMADDPHSLRQLANVPAAIRSRNTVARRVINPLLNSDQPPTPEVAEALLKAFNGALYGGSSAESGAQPLLLGLPEVEFLAQQAQRIAEAHPEDPEAAAQAAKGLFTAGGDSGKNFRAFRQHARLPAGIEGALFGRMVTADPAANITAAVSVAHAFTVHAEETNNDYFSVVDDLHEPGEGPMAAHIGAADLNTGLYYGYAVIDLPELVSNLEGCPAEEWTQADRELAGQAAASLTHLIATVSPGAKKGATAPYSRAELMLLEAGDDQPRTLANAFRDPVAPTVSAAVAAMKEHLSNLDAAYGAATARRLMTVADAALPAAPRLSLPDLAQWAREIIRNASAEL